jgi:K+ transporter
VTTEQLERVDLPTAPPAAPTAAGHGPARPTTGKAAALLSLGALGVVYGDIGTSPLYTVQTIFAGDHPLRPSAANVYGTTSLIVWSLVMIVTLKYVLLVMRADNNGEGGIMALVALVERALKGRRVPGTSVFLANSLDTVPPALLNNVKHNRVLHEQVVLLRFETLGVPHVDDTHRITIDRMRLGFVGVTARYGFQETPNAVTALEQAARDGLEIDLEDTSYYVSHTSVLRTGDAEFAHWRKLLFTLLYRGATPPAQYYDMPTDRVFEVGTYVEV